MKIFSFAIYQTERTLLIGVTRMVSWGGRESVKYIFSISDLHVISQFILVKFTQAYLFLFAEYSSYQIAEKRSSKLKFKIKIFSI